MPRPIAVTQGGNCSGQRMSSGHSEAGTAAKLRLIEGIASFLSLGLLRCLLLLSVPRGGSTHILISLQFTLTTFVDI
jgi:hypothetical protein